MQAWLSFKSIFYICLICLLTSIQSQATENKPNRKRQVLAIVFEAEGQPFEANLIRSLRSNLNATSSHPIELYVEYSDRLRYAGEAYLEKLMDLYRYKYSRPHLDVVVGIGDEAAEILVDQEKALFDNTPMIVVSANPKYLERGTLKPNMTALLW